MDFQATFRRGAAALRRRCAEMTMTQTQALLGKIAALRQRLDQAQSLASEARSALAALAGDEEDEIGLVLAFERQAEAGAAHDAALDRVVRPLTGPAGLDAPPATPRPLTARARRVLERGRDLLTRLRELDDAFADPIEAPPPAGGPHLPLDRSEPLARLYRETITLTDTALRTVPLFPDTTTAQMQLCEGLEAILNVVASRLRQLVAGVGRHRHEAGQVTRLATLLTELATGGQVPAADVKTLVEEIVTDAACGGPLRFVEADTGDLARFVACHSLSVARVAARVARHDPDFRSHPGDAVAAALLMDVGMLRIDGAVLAHPGPLDVPQRRAVEMHGRLGAELLVGLRGDFPAAVVAALNHHERLDGTGYPEGLREPALPPVVRLLAVCDVYAAFCAPRPHRPGRETRTALADTLLQAEQGLLDRHYAECLLQLSFYPVGSVVELADGSVGVVVATPGLRRDLNSPARPVVAVLLDGQGEPLPRPRHLDLAQYDGPSVVRTLDAAERREALGASFPEWL
jgi:HD-GYP domain-containing protein (c-di-GMP phosphodiesterase class II)